MTGKRCSPRRDGSNSFTGKEGVVAAKFNVGGDLERRSGGRTPKLRQVLGKRTCGKGRLHESQLHHPRGKREEERDPSPAASSSSGGERWRR
jgi:hypothetical protein